jgi:hypothetical protein
MRELIRRGASHPSAFFNFLVTNPVTAREDETSPHRTATSTTATMKKRKKMLELEEKWEMELKLEEEVEGWWVLIDEKDWAGDEPSRTRY